MMLFTSDLFVGLAFDSGGVTGGALTSAFLTPLTLGTAQAVAQKAGGAAQSVLTNGFGIIAFISVTPLIAVQALGILYARQMRIAKRRQDAQDELDYDELASFAASIADDEGEEETMDTNTQAPEKQAQQPEPAPEQQPEGAAQVACASPTGGISP